MTRQFHFGSGPATLPLEVLEEAREALLELPGEGLGVLELPHRGPGYERIHGEAEAAVRRLLGADEAWAALFLQGGASLQFALVPMNLGPDGDVAVTGTWTQKALEEARRLGGAARAAADTGATNFDRLPDALDLRPGASYLHIASNETIHGVQWPALPASAAPLVVDASSDILARPLDLARCGVVFAGAQKNLGAAGVTLVLVRRALLDRAPATLPAILSWRAHAAAGSALNTPPVFAVFVLGLMLRWTERQGGVEALAARNAARAARLYAALDARPDVYAVHARPGARSTVNVPFRLATPALEAAFLEGAAREGLLGLAGHRSVGGVRASLYNAMPDAGVARLIAWVEAFAAEARAAGAPAPPAPAPAAGARA